jgi:hypothetical protein
MIDEILATFFVNFCDRVFVVALHAKVGVRKEKGITSVIWSRVLFCAGI